MSITKLKPVRTPRLLDEWTEKIEVARKETARESQMAIEHSRKLVEQSKEIMAKMRHRPKKSAGRKAG